MTYAQALMIVRNATSGYKTEEIRKAASFILSTLDASEEDQLDAASALAYADQRNVRVSYSPGARCGELDDHPFSGAVSAGDY